MITEFPGFYSKKSKTNVYEFKATHETIESSNYDTTIKTGHPCKVDIGAIDNGKASVSDGTYTYHGEEIRLYCDEGFVPLYAKAKTCKNGTFAPSFHQAPFVCVDDRKIFSL